MKIGLDIDGVIIDSERGFKVSAELFSLEHFGEDRLVDNSVAHVEERYNWPDEYKKKWHYECLTKVAEESNFMPGAIEVIKRLKDMGHELVIITARGGFVPRMKDIALEQFEKAGLKFDDYHFVVHEKGKLCKEIGIDVMIEDEYNNCLKVANEGITTLYFRDVKMKKIEKENVKEVNNWGEIYKYFMHKFSS